MPNAKIEQIRLGGKVYDIEVKKDWVENDTEAISYIQNRSHYRYEALGRDIPGDGSTYTFSNGYTENKDCNYTDLWTPADTWIYPGKPYNFTLTLAADRRIEFTGVSLPETTDGYATILPREGEEVTPENSFQGKVQYNAHTNTFRIIDEAYDELTLRSNLFILTIKACADTTYKLVKQLDADFLPLDNKSIGKNEAGQISVLEPIYESDFKVTEQFGKYEPLSTVPAKGKSLKDVIDDAFCTDIQPEVKKRPSLTIELSTNEDIYELGETATCTWTLTFDRGAYSYGMLDRKLVKTDFPSDLYVNDYKVNWCDQIFTGTPLGSEQDFKNNQVLSTSFEYTIPSDKEITVAESALAEVKYTAVKDTDDKYMYLPSTLLGKTSTLLDEAGIETVRKDMSQANKEFKCTASAAKVQSSYRWFWIFNPDDTFKAESVRELANLSPDSGIQGGSKLGGFNSSETTDKLQSAYFLIPKAKNIQGINMTNAATGASACISWNTEVWSIPDASKTNYHDYDVYWFKNAKADSGANIYNIEVIEEIS
jgi:hypothetical protein